MVGSSVGVTITDDVSTVDSTKLTRLAFNNGKSGKMRVYMMFSLLVSILIISSGLVSAACVRPTDGMTITANTVLCPGTYYLNNYRTSPVITIGGDNIKLDCNGSTLINNQSTITLTGIYAEARDNVVITNCNLKNFRRGITLMGDSNVLINKTTILNSAFQGIYAGGNYNLVIDRVEVSNTAGEHGLYLDTLFDNTDSKYSTSGVNAVVMNSEFNNNKVYGIHINGANQAFYKNVKIHHNTFTGNNEAIDDMACRGCEYYRNTMTDDIAFFIRYNGESELLHWSENNKIHDNVIKGNSDKTRDLWITSKSRNNAFYNNTYSDGIQRIFSGGVYDFQDYSATFEEYTDDIIIYVGGSSSTTMEMDYPGRKTFTINNSRISLSNLKAPYNDVKDVSTNKVLASNVNSYSITLGADDRIAVGNFVIDTIVPIRLPPIVSVILSSPDSTINSDLRCNYTVTGRNDVSVNTTIAWYKNGVLAINNGVSVLAKKNLTVGDRWYCRVTARDSFNTTSVNSNTLTIVSSSVPVIRTPPTLTVSMSSVDGSNTINSDLRCDYTVSGNNGVAVNTTISWYKNSIRMLNGPTILGKKNLTVGDVWYCKVIATDTYNTTNKNSNSITIKASTPVNPSVRTPPTITVSMSSVDGSNTINSDLRCDYTVSGNNGVAVNTTISWYKNSTRILNGPTILGKKNLTVGDVWYCKVIAADIYNNTNKNSNSITIIEPPVIPSDPIVEPEEERRGGGGGGGSSYSPAEEIFISSGDENSSNSSGELNLTINHNPVPGMPNASGNISNDTTNVLSGNVVLKTVDPKEYPEQPSTAELEERVNDDNSSYRGALWPSVLVVLTLIGFGLLATKLPQIKAARIKTDPSITEFIEKALYIGYDYPAIKVALRKKFSPAIVNHHIDIVQMHTPGPKTHFRNPMPSPHSYSKYAINQLKEYVDRQRVLGFHDKDIKRMLIHYGYSVPIVEEASA